jgi:4a-hydroxytetrahydrobiopterin dehydratase
MSEQPFDKTQGEPLARKKCIPCEEGGPPLLPERAQELLKELNPEWMLIDGGRLLARTFKFDDFMGPMHLANKIAAIAEEEGHHPDLTIGYGSLGVELMTHAIGGLSENDFIVASKVDQIKL